MIELNIYCKVSGMVVECIRDLGTRGMSEPVVVEIGCADGQGTMRYAGFSGLTICVDPMVEGRPDLVPGNATPIDEKKLDIFFRRTQEFNVRLVTGISQEQKTLDSVKQFLGDLEVDILVIDGCHHPLSAVQMDFDMYYPLVKVGGMVIFDDLYETEDILPAYQRAIDEFGMIEHERWRWNKPNTLQEVAALRKTRP